MKNVKPEETFSPDDPRLTAYALGELEGEDLAAAETALAHDAEARATVEAVRALAGHMTAALAGETAPAAPMTPTVRAAPPLRPAASVNGHDPRQLDGAAPRRRAPLIRFPQFYFIVTGLAAACFVIFVTLRSPEPAAPPAVGRKVYTEIVFAPTPASLPVSMPVATGAAEAVAAVEPESPAAVNPAPVPTTPSLVEQVKTEADEKRAPFGPITPAPPRTFSVANHDTFGGNLPSTTEPAPAPAPERVTAAPARNWGQVSVSSRAAAGLPTEGETVVLSAFSVSESATGSYGANSMSGARRGREPHPTPPRGARFGANTEAYAYTPDNDFLGAAQNPLSTFSVDVDTASYANVRRFLTSHRLPPRDAVRVEELLNYFPYRYAPPTDERPFAASLEVAEAPWAPAHRLVRIGLKGREVTTAARPAANLVFLLDVSGSMNAPNRLPLVKESMRLLVGKLRPDDRVAIVTYAGDSGLALPSTPVARAREILESLDALTPGGSTNGAMGIELAYDIAKANFVSGGINRVILCTDGDFNVGVTSEGELTRLITDKAKSGVFLTVLGFGLGNLKDATLEKLADQGNGNYGYIDTRREAEKLLVEQVNGTLLTIAKDVKIQVEFNPAKVASYRLIGYENRLLKKEDFNNDKVDAGEIGAGHTVTALYEIVPVGAAEKSDGDEAAPVVDELKYQRVEPATGSRLAMLAGKTDAASAELLTVKIRYKKPDGFISHKVEFPLVDAGKSFAEASADFKFAAAVAGFGMILRDSPHKGTATFDQVAGWAAAGTLDDVGGWRSEFLELTRIARTL
jgi:Ca-activated chloride channel family protein